jgi:hypothetical protein
LKGNDALGKIVRFLNETGIPHMIAGSFASTYHGISRTTADIDVVIDPSNQAFNQFLALLAVNGFYVSEANAKAALRSRSQFNVIDMASVWKIDLIIRKHRPYSEVEFHRREAASIMDVDTYVASAEDTILTKLEWAKGSDSERQRRDIEGIIEVKGRQLDRTYLEQWASKLGLSDALKQVMQ